MNFIKDQSTLKTLNEILKEKTCIYPDCNTIFYGRGAQKYCLEHQKKEYKKFLYTDKYLKKIKDNRKSNIENNNQIINHKLFQTSDIICTCALENCNNKFNLKLIPRVYVYPKFCPEHRNEFRRKNFTIQMKNETNKA